MEVFEFDTGLERMKKTFEEIPASEMFFKQKKVEYLFRELEYPVVLVIKDRVIEIKETMLIKGKDDLKPLIDEQLNDGWMSGHPDSTILVFISSEEVFVMSTAEGEL